MIEVQTVSGRGATGRNPNKGAGPPNAESGKRNMKEKNLNDIMWGNIAGTPKKGAGLPNAESGKKNMKKKKIWMISCEVILPEPQKRGLVCQMQSQEREKKM